MVEGETITSENLIDTRMRTEQVPPWPGNTAPDFWRGTATGGGRQGHSLLSFLTRRNNMFSSKVLSMLVFYCRKAVCPHDGRITVFQNTCYMPAFRISDGFFFLIFLFLSGEVWRFLDIFFYNGHSLFKNYPIILIIICLGHF